MKIKPFVPNHAAPQQCLFSPEMQPQRDQNSWAMPDADHTSMSATPSLKRYEHVFSRYKGEEIIDLDKQLRIKPDLELYRLEDFIPKVKGILPPARRSAYCITLVKKGSGQARIGEFTFPIEDHILSVVPQRALHSSIYDRTGCSGYLLMFTDDFFLNNAFPLKCLKNRKVLHNTGTPYLRLRMEQVRKLSKLFECLIRSTSKAEPTGKDRLAIKVLDLLVECDELFNGLAVSSEVDWQHPILQRFFDVMEQHYRSEHSVQFYAGVLNTHPNHLNYLLKRHTGYNAKECIDRRVIKESKLLLGNSTLIIKEVAYRLGFDDPNNYSSYFQKHTGIPPVKYRASQAQLSAPHHIGWSAGQLTGYSIPSENKTIILH